MTITSTQNRVSYAGNGAPGVPCSNLTISELADRR